MKNLYDHVTKNFGVLQITIEEDIYHIRPVNVSKSVMKVVVTLEVMGDYSKENESKFTDRIDLYCSSARKGFANEAAQHFCEDPLYLEWCLQRLIEKIERKYERELEKARLIAKNKLDKSITVQHFPEVSGVVRTGFFGLVINGFKLKIIQPKDYIAFQK